MPKGPDYESYAHGALAEYIANLLRSCDANGELNPEQVGQLEEAFAELEERVSAAFGDN